MARPASEPGNLTCAWDALAIFGRADEAMLGKLAAQSGPSSSTNDKNSQLQCKLCVSEAGHAGEVL